MLLDALSAAAAEITRELAPGSVDVRLRGRDPDFVVTVPPAELALDGTNDGATAEAYVSPDLDDGAVSRINFRAPENLKVRIEEAAARDGLSVNAWLVRLTAAAVEHDDRRRRPRRGSTGVGQSYTGWVR